MEQLEFDDYFQRLEKQRQLEDDIFGCFERIANAPYQPNTLFIHPDTYQQMSGYAAIVWDEAGTYDEATAEIIYNYEEGLESPTLRRRRARRTKTEQDSLGYEDHTPSFWCSRRIKRGTLPGAEYKNCFA